MHKNMHIYIKLFTTTFMLSAFTFGGGYVIIPLMKQKFVDHLEWLTEEEVLNLVAIAQSAPGPIAVNASILLGFRVAGIFGAIATILGTILPPLITLSIISVFYVAFRDNIYVSAALRGMQAGVAAVIADVVLDMASVIVKERKKLSIAVMCIAFVATYWIGLNVVYTIFACALLGALQSRKKENIHVS